MAAIKNKIKDLMHKDSPSSTTTSGHDNTTTGSSSQNKGGVGSAVKGAMAGYDGTTSTGHQGASNTTSEQDVRTGMSDLDITTGTNKDTYGTGPTTGLTGRDETSVGRHHDSTGTGMTGQDTTDRAFDSTTTGSGYGATSGTDYETGNTSGGISQGVTRSYDNTTNEIIDSERFTKTEDHEIVIEKKAYELEHRPVQKKYVVETRYEGERAVPGKATELLSTEAREVEERVVSMPQGDREIIVENVDVPLEGAELVETHRVRIPHSEQKVTSTGLGAGALHQHGATTGSGLGDSSYQQGTTGTGTGTGLGSSQQGTGLGSGTTGTY